MAMESEVAWLFIAAGVLVWLLRAPPAWLRQRGLPAIAMLPEAPGMFSVLDLSTLTKIGIFKKLQEPLVVVAAAALGRTIYPPMHP